MCVCVHVRRSAAGVRADPLHWYAKCVQTRRENKHKMRPVHPLQLAHPFPHARALWTALLLRC